MRTTRLVLAIVLVLGALAGGVFLGVKGTSLFSSGEVHESRSSEIIHSVMREEKVVLLSLAIQGVEVDERSNGDFGWIKIPGTERKSILVYSFDAQLGLEGKDVEIREVSEGRFIVTIPDFIFIGHKVHPFESAIEHNGALSWMTEGIDTTDLVNNVLSEEKQSDYLALHRETLMQQASAFYERIITSIDPSAMVEFEFASSP